jgi:hypothetical protein
MIIETQKIGESMVRDERRERERNKETAEREEREIKITMVREIT